MNKVFIFWDNSNIFIGAKDIASEREGFKSRNLIRISFPALLDLCKAGREVAQAIAVGSIPPEIRHVWNRMEGAGVEVQLFERGYESHKEQGVDAVLQVAMLRAAFDNNGSPQTVVLLTGDGRGFEDGAGFHADLERMHKKGWEIEILAWEGSCNKKMKDWGNSVGIFIPLEDYYNSITYTEDYERVIREQGALDLSKRPLGKRFLK